MCTSNEDCIEFVAKADEHGTQIRFTPYGGIMQYTLPQGIFVGSFYRPDLSYLLGINSSISSRRWMSSISGIVDMSFSRLVTTDGFFNYSCTLFSPQIGLRYTYHKGSVRPFIGAGADISILITSDSNREDAKLLKAVYPGYYAEAGLDVHLSKKRARVLNIRFQFKNIRSVEAKCNFAYGWSGIVGYTFQIR